MVAAVEAVFDVAEVRQRGFPDALAGVVIKLGDDEEVPVGRRMRHQEIAQDGVGLFAARGRRHHRAEVVGLDRRLIDQGLIQTLGLDEEGGDAGQQRSQHPGDG